MGLALNKLSLEQKEARNASLQKTFFQNFQIAKAYNQSSNVWEVQGNVTQIYLSFLWNEKFESKELKPTVGGDAARRRRHFQLVVDVVGFGVGVRILENERMSWINKILFKWMYSRLLEIPAACKDYSWGLSGK